MRAVIVSEYGGSPEVEEGVTAINFQLPASAELMQRVADALASGRIVAPPVTRISLARTPSVFAAESSGAPDGKTVIVLGQAA